MIALHEHGRIEEEKIKNTAYAVRVGQHADGPTWTRFIGGESRAQVIDIRAVKRMAKVKKKGRRDGGKAGR